VTKEQRMEKARELRATAERMRESVSSSDGPSSENWVSPERYTHYMDMAREKDKEAEALESEPE
jgi:hypothetical protein